MLELLLFISSYGRIEIVETIDYCDLNIDHLSLEMKVEMMFGCSTVNGKTIFDDNKLKSIYGRK